MFVEPQYSPCVAFAEPAHGDGLTLFVGELEHTQLVGNKALTLAQAFGQLLLCQIKSVYERTIAFRLFEKVQILALKVLDDCGNGRVLLLHIGADDAADRFIAEAFDCAQSSLAGNELIALTVHPDHKRLDKAHLLDRFGKLRNAVLIKALSGLIGIRDDGSHRKFHELSGVVFLVLA